MGEMIMEADDDKELQAWRRRVFASIGGWLDMAKGKVPEGDKEAYERRVAYIKAMACRATGYDAMNKIPVSRLRNLYYLYVKQQRDWQRGYEVCDGVLKELTELN